MYGKAGSVHYYVYVCWCMLVCICTCTYYVDQVIQTVFHIETQCNTNIVCSRYHNKYSYGQFKAVLFYLDHVSCVCTYASKHTTPSPPHIHKKCTLSAISASLGPRDT